jgi:enoyl-CoA hydratase/carnithine racemase
MTASENKPVRIELPQRGSASEVAYITLDEERRLNCLSETMLDNLIDARPQR